jgi:glycosyltransferase involved in cell wall biosynthesis
MRIIILTAIPFWHPGTAELVDHLRKKGVHITALDIFHGRKYNAEGEIENLLPFQIKGLAARLYLKIFRKSFTRKHTKRADLLDIHFVEPAYSKYIPDLGKKFICTLFGSDLFRTNTAAKEQQRVLFETCSGILLSKNMIPYFEEHFGDKSRKYQLNQYGSARIDSVYEAVQQLSKDELQKKWDIPSGKTYVTIGYNGKQEQQHLKVLEKLESLTTAEKSQLFFLFPMTYGGDELYHKSVTNKASTMGLEFDAYFERMSDQEITELRILSDISINTQTTDALASSVKEALVSGDILLVGDWLPYDIYKELGVFYQTTDFPSLTSNLKGILKDVDKLKEQSSKNADIIRKFASWNVLIDQWVEDYERLYNEGK